MAFAYKLEREDGTPADPPTLPHGRIRVESRRLDSAGSRSDTPRH